MDKFINLRQRGMSMKKYSLKFTQLYYCCGFWVKMGKFVMVLSNLVVNECRLPMLIRSMDISSLMVYSQKLEEKKFKQVGRELKRTRAEYGNSSNARFEVQDKPRFKKRFPKERPSTILGSAKVKCLHGNLKRRQVVVILFKRILVLNVVENMNATVYWYGKFLCLWKELSDE